VVDRTALEMRHTGNRIGGSNPSLSATSLSTWYDAGPSTTSCHHGPAVIPIRPIRKLQGRPVQIEPQHGAEEIQLDARRQSGPTSANGRAVLEQIAKAGLRVGTTISRT
jgi:hypothetical protein